MNTMSGGSALETRMCNNNTRSPARREFLKYSRSGDYNNDNFGIKETELSKTHLHTYS